MVFFEVCFPHQSGVDPDLFSDRLLELGAFSATLEEPEGATPILEPPLDSAPVWPGASIKALFDNQETMKDSLQALMSEYGEIPHEIREVPEQIWQNLYQAQFQPLKVGEKTWICPSWHTPPEPEACNILLDPGLAFGTGSHPTTALCLEWIDSAALSGKKVIDYGCGSGILSIAALLHGAEHVYAVDHDPQAVKATQENLERNGFSADRATVCLPAALPHAVKADVLVANILLKPLIDLLPIFKSHLIPNGVLVLSGILQNQLNSLLKAYGPFCHQVFSLERENWVRVEAHLTAPKEFSYLQLAVKKALEEYYQSVDSHDLSNVYELVLGEVEPAVLKATLDLTGGKQSNASRILGLSRNTLRKLLDKYQLKSL